MMKPIVLSEFGETLVSLFDDARIINSIRIGIQPRDQGIVGKHDICGGWIQLRQVSSTHNALCCGVCGLRVVVPSTLNTLGKLYDWCIDQMQQKQAYHKNVHEAVVQTMKF